MFVGGGAFLPHFFVENCSENAGNSVLEVLEFKNFRGGMPYPLEITTSQMSTGQI